MNVDQILPEMARVAAIGRHTDDEIREHFAQLYPLVDYHDRKVFLFGQGRDFKDRRHIIILHPTASGFTPEHIYSYAMLTYCYQGSFPMVIDGERRVLQPGDCAVLDRHVPHEVETTGPDDLTFNMVLADDFFQGPLLEGITDLASPFASELATTGAAHNRWRVYHTAGDELTRTCIDRILCEWLEPDMTSPNIIDLLLATLLLHLLRTHEPKGELDDVAWERAELTGRVRQYVSNNYQEGNLTHMAQDLGYERTYLSKFVRQVTGVTFKQLVNEERMRHAALMLRGTTKPVYEVAQAVGMANLTNFYQRFREYAGCTPQEYRDLV